MIAYLYDKRTFDKVSDAEFIALLESSKPRTLEMGLPIPDDEKFIYQTLETRSQHRRPDTTVSNDYYLASWKGFHYLIYRDADKDSNHLALHRERDNTYPGKWHRISAEGRIALAEAQKEFPDLQIVSSGMFSTKEKSNLPFFLYYISGMFLMMFLAIFVSENNDRAKYHEKSAPK